MQPFFYRIISSDSRQTNHDEREHDRWTGKQTHMPQQMSKRCTHQLNIGEQHQPFMNLWAAAKPEGTSSERCECEQIEEIEYGTRRSIEQSGTQFLITAQIEAPAYH